MEGRSTLPIGTDDFRELRENNAYYVDKMDKESCEKGLFMR